MSMEDTVLWQDRGYNELLKSVSLFALIFVSSVDPGFGYDQLQVTLIATHVKLFNLKQKSRIDCTCA
jgi:hypothetical protein